MIRKLIHLVLTLGIVAGLGYVLWLGLHKHQAMVAASADTDGTPAAAENPAAEFTVTLDQEKTAALAIETAPPQPFTLQATRLAFGSVMDPSPLISLDGDLTAAEAALGASQAENARTMALAATHDASKQSAEAAEARFLADKVKVDGLIRGAQIQWGVIFTRETASRRTFITDLVTGSVALIRVDVMPGDVLVEIPASAQIVVMGRENQPFTTSEILPATVADLQTQAQGFILRVAKPPFTLRPGMALSAWLKLPGAPRSGFVIPRAAVLRHDGHAWVYVRKGAAKFWRKPITLDTPLGVDQGWFITADGGLAPADDIVGTGAASLLSEELKSQGGSGPD